MHSTHLFNSRATADFDMLFIIDRLTEKGGAELALARLACELPAHGIRPLVLTFSHNICEELRQQFTCPIQVIPLRRSYGPGALYAARRIRGLILSHKIRLVHTFFETSDLFGGMVVRSVPRVALVTSRRDMGILRGVKHRFAYPVFSRLSHRVVAVSESVRQWCIRADRLNSRRVVTVYNGVEADRCFNDCVQSRRYVRESLGIREDQVVISAIGNVRHVKGYDLLVEAASLLLPQHPEVVFLVAGAEHEVGRQSELNQQMRMRNTGGGVRFIGAMQDAKPLLNASDIFVLPSRSEGFSNALIEAMACGLPSVVTNVGGNAEAVLDSVSGIIVQSENAQAIASALERLVTSAELRKSMGKEGRRIVQQRFTHEAMIQNMLSVYREALVSAGA